MVKAKALSTATGDNVKFETEESADCGAENDLRYTRDPVCVRADIQYRGIRCALIRRERTYG